MYRDNYNRCTDGQKHSWYWNGGSVIERRTGRLIETQTCSKCRLSKQVFADTKRRLIR